jgi:hypothetical protein
MGESEKAVFTILVYFLLCIFENINMIEINKHPTECSLVAVLSQIGRIRVADPTSPI